MPRRLLWLLLVLFAIRVAATLYAYDRRPVITSNDEIYWAEPAWSLLHGQGYRLPCCDGMLFGDFYPQHPPIYVWILAGSFSLFGFTPAAMRLPSIVMHIAGIGLLLMLLWRLRKLRVLDRWGFIVAAILALCDFSTLSLSRGGRPDPFTTDFALLGFLFLLSGRMTPTLLQRRAWVASVFFGLAIGTHTIAVFYLGLFVLVLWRLRRRLGPGWWLYPLISLGVFAGLWASVFGARSLEALVRHREIAAQMGGASKPAFRSVGILLNGPTEIVHLHDFVQAGGTTAVVILASFLLFAVRIVSDHKNRKHWALLAVALAGQFALMVGVTSLGITRCYIYFPFTVFVIGVAITRWRSALRWLVIAGVVLLAIVECGQSTYFLSGAYRDYAIRSPNRHDALMARLATYRRVAVLPVLWHQARLRGLDFVLVDLSAPQQRHEWMSKDHPFAEFDAVVLEGGHPLCESADLANIKPEDFYEVGPHGLVLYELNPPNK